MLSFKVLIKTSEASLQSVHIDRFQPAGGLLDDCTRIQLQEQSGHISAVPPEQLQTQRHSN